MRSFKSDSNEIALFCSNFRKVAKGTPESSAKPSWIIPSNAAYPE